MSLTLNNGTSSTLPTNTSTAGNPRGTLTIMEKTRLEALSHQPMIDGTEMDSIEYHTLLAMSKGLMSREEADRYGELFLEIKEKGGIHNVSVEVRQEFEALSQRITLARLSMN